MLVLQLELFYCHFAVTVSGFGLGLGLESFRIVIR